MGFSILVLFSLNKTVIHLSLVDILILSFVITGVVITYYNNQEVSTKLILFILLFVSYLYFRFYSYLHKSSGYFLTISFILIAMIEAVWGLRQLYGFSHSNHSLFSTTGSFFNPGPFAGYIALALPMYLYYILNDWRISNREFNRRLFPFYIRLGVSVIAFITVMLILPATMSRASWLSAIAGCSFIGIYWGGEKYNVFDGIKTYIKHNKLKIFTIGITVILLIIFVCSTLYNLKKDSADGRLLIWKTSLKIISEHPMGVGLGNFSGSYGEQQAEYFESG